MRNSLVIAIVLCRLIDYVVSQDPVASSSVSALLSSQSSQCVSFISAYPPTVSLYASQACQVCQNLQISPSIEPCCSNSNPTACFASSLYGISVTDGTRSAPITTSAASLGSVNCDAVISILEFCEAATPGFDDLCFHDQQSCLCSTSGTWAPSYYDNFWSGCLAWASTAAPASYSLLGPNADGQVQSRKCQSYASLTATGGIPSNCLVSSPNTLSTTSLTSTGSAGLQSTSSPGLAVDARKPGVSAILITTYKLTDMTRAGARLRDCSDHAHSHDICRAYMISVTKIIQS